MFFEVVCSIELVFRVLGGGSDLGSLLKIPVVSVGCATSPFFFFFLRFRVFFIETSSGLGFRVWGLLRGLGFRVWGLLRGLGFRV